MPFHSNSWNAKTSPDQTAEYSNWMRIFNRLEDTCDSITIASVEVRLGNTSALDKFYVLLLEFFEQMRPIIGDLIAKDIDAKFAEAEKQLRVWKVNMQANRAISDSSNLVKFLEVIKNDLYRIKQEKRLGIPAEKSETDKTKIKRALGTGPDE